MPVRLKGNNWCVDFTLDGQRVREFGFPSRTNAEAWELEARAALKRGHPVPVRLEKAQDSLRTVKDVFDWVVSTRWTSRKTSNALAYAAMRFVDWVGPATSAREAFSTQTMARYMIHMRDRLKNSGSTINRRLTLASTMARAAHELGVIDAMPAIPWQKEGQGRLRWFTEDEERQIFTTLGLWAKHDLRDLFMFLVDTGARPGEAIKLEWSDVSRDGRIVTFWETKNGEHRSVPLTARARDAVQRRRAETPDLAGPFQAIKKTHMEHVWERLRTHLPFLEDAVIYTFRHTCASRLVQRGVDIYRVKVWMGHKNIIMTQRYAHLAPTHLEDALILLEGSKNR